jgi:pyruvate kinase
MSRRTKIICTIGPKTNTFENLEILAKKGMNIARLNMSHGTHEWHADVVNSIKKLNATGDYSIAIMLDTKGPEIRSGDLKEPLEINIGDVLTFTNQVQVEKDKYTLDINYDDFVNDVEIGDIVLVDSGIINLEVIDKNQHSVTVKSLDSGVITSRRHLNIKGKSANLPAITDKDWLDIDFAIEQEVNFIALSFANDAEVVTHLKKYLSDHKSGINVIPKIESTNAVKNLESIVLASDGIMVARGDLGAELPIEDVPIIQDRIVKLCRKVGKPVIVATQLLESMMVSPTPTRAEVTDIFHAVTQKADAIMMSGETASGNHPFKALDVMSTVAKRAEQHYSQNWQSEIENSDIPKNEIVLGASVVANNINAKAIMVFTKSGWTTGLVSQCRPHSLIFSFTDSHITNKKLNLYWGVTSLTMAFSENPEETVENAMQYLKVHDLVKQGDNIVIVSDILAGKELVDAVQIRVVK